MTPLFDSTPPQSLPPELCWHVEAGKDHVGKTLYLAGKAITLITHRVGRRTWPCLYQWPKLGRECPHCDRSRRSTTWVPLVKCEAPFKKFVLMGGEKTWLSVKDLTPNTLVTCHFARVVRPTLVFGKEKLPLGVTLMNFIAEGLGSGKGDITRWLLHYWQWPELTRWYGEVHRESLRTRAIREKAEVTGFDVFGSVA